MTSIRIEIKGVLDKHWTDCFPDITFNYIEENTILTGTVPDQSALHGILNTIRDLNLHLISICSDTTNETIEFTN